MTAPSVLVLGDANVDMVIQLRDRTMEATSPSSAPQLYGGGSAANVTVALARLGVDVSMLGKVGDDGFGRWVLDDLAREGVKIDGLGTASEAFTTVVMALIEPDGERQIVIWPQEGAAHNHLFPGEIDPLRYKSATWLHTSGICLREYPVQDAVLHAMDVARRAKITVSLDLNLRMETWGLDDNARVIFARAIELSDVVFGNAYEEIIPLAREQTAEGASRILCDGQRTVIARLGDQGALVTTPEGNFRVPAFSVNVVDTLGAGDAFNGGFIAARLAEQDLQQATRWGHAVAALKIGRPGARGLPTMDELLAKLA